MMVMVTIIYFGNILISLLFGYMSFEVQQRCQMYIFSEIVESRLIFYAVFFICECKTTPKF
jgi:hypothetical protein